MALHVGALQRTLRTIAAGNLGFLDYPGVRTELAAWAKTVARRVERVVA